MLENLAWSLPDLLAAIFGAVVAIVVWRRSTRSAILLLLGSILWIGTDAGDVIFAQLLPLVLGHAAITRYQTVTGAWNIAVGVLAAVAWLLAALAALLPPERPAERAQ